MSFIVKGMWMPQDCNSCIVADGYGWVLCRVAGRFWDTDKGQPKRPDWCPLAPLPEKHGRLIDGKELEKAILKWLPPDPCGREEMEYPFETDICVSMMMEIGDQETIVEAEGEI